MENRRWKIIMYEVPDFLCYLFLYSKSLKGDNPEKPMQIRRVSVSLCSQPAEKHCRILYESKPQEEDKRKVKYRCSEEIEFNN